MSTFSRYRSVENGAESERRSTVGVAVPAELNVRVEGVEQAEIVAGGRVFRQFDSHQIVRLKRGRNPIVRAVGNLVVITRRIDEKRNRRSEGEETFSACRSSRSSHRGVVKVQSCEM